MPVLFFNYVGFELPNAAGDEMKDPQKDVPFTVIRAAIGTFVLYGAPILAILLVLPTAQITSLGGFIDAMKTVFTVYGGHVTTAADGTVTATLTGAGKVLGDLAAIGFIWALLSSGTTWIMGADRAQAVAGFDGAAPRWFGVFSKRWGTPIVVNLLSGVFSTIVMVLAFALTSGSAGKYFTVVLGLAISTTTIAYVLVFPALIKLRYTHPHVPAALPRAGRDGGRVDRQHPHHRLGGARDGRAAVPGVRHGASGRRAARGLRARARRVRAVAVRPARGAARARRALLLERPQDPGAEQVDLSLIPEAPPTIA